MTWGPANSSSDQEVCDEAFVRERHELELSVGTFSAEGLAIVVVDLTQFMFQVSELSNICFLPIYKVLDRFERSDEVEAVDAIVVLT